MALKQPYLFKGKEANYWPITRLSPSKKDGKTVITVGLYFDEGTRQVDKDAKTWNNLILEQDFIVSGLFYTEADAYKALKALPAFDGAVDC